LFDTPHVEKSILVAAINENKVLKSKCMIVCRLSLKKLGIINMSSEKPSSQSAPLTAHIFYNDAYVQPLILSALTSRLSPTTFKYSLVTDEPSETTSEDAPDSSLSDTRTLQILPYESLNFTKALDAPTGAFLMNSYVYRKALIRKHFLANVVRMWSAKNPESILKTNVPVSCEIEVDYAEFLDDAVVDAWELRESLDWKGLEDEDEEDDASEEKTADQREWWVLKPGMSDGANGIRLFSSEKELRRIFEAWDPPDSDGEDEDETEKAGDGQSSANTGQIFTSQLRHFVTQRYIHPPLLLPSPSPLSNRKFHIRTYVLCVGALKAFVYRPMLALFSSQAYIPPWQTARDEAGNLDLSAHLTNTCFQTSSLESTSKVDVEQFWQLPEVVVPGIDDWKTNVFGQICNISSDIILAAARTDGMNFQPLPSAFEVFGVDFLVDAEGKAWLLEVNAFPDFKQTGDDLKDLVGGLWEEVVDAAIKPYFFPGLDLVRDEPHQERMVKVLDIDLGR
jgi:tubulin--tyrosine ligase